MLCLIASTRPDVGAKSGYPCPAVLALPVFSIYIHIYALSSLFWGWGVHFVVGYEKYRVKFLESAKYL